MRTSRKLALGILVAVAGCGGGGTDPDPGTSLPPPPPPSSIPVASISLSRDTATILAQATLLLVATPKDASGNALAGRTVTWTSSAAAVATVSSTGMITGVTPGTAVIEAAIGAIKAQSTITVLANPGGETSFRSGSLVLPAGTRIGPAALTVQNSLGHVTPGTDGTFALLSITSGPQLAAAFASGGRPILMGWLDPQLTTLTARTTAEVLAYFDLGGPMLPVEGRTFLLQELAHRTELAPLVAAITAALAADPATVTLDIAAVHLARKQVHDVLLPASLVASQRARQSIVMIDPLAAKSGIVVNETDLNTIVITNQYRRRATALLDRVSYVPALGSNRIASLARIEKQDIEATYGVTSVAGLLGDVVLGNLAWAEREYDPIGIPMFPTDADTTIYRLRVLGLGRGSSAEVNTLSAADQTELRLVMGKAILLDFVLPVVSNILLDTKWASENLETALGTPSGAAAVSDFLDIMFSLVPELYGKFLDGDNRGAAEAVISKLGTLDNFQSALFDLVAALSSSRFVNPGSVRGPIAEFGEQVLGFVGKLDRWMTVFDTCLQGWQVGNSKGIETWELKVVPSKVVINPPAGTIGKNDIQLLKADIHGLANLAPGAALEYKWSTTGQHGTLYDANNSNKTTITSSSDAVTYTPTRLSTGTDVITVEITRKQAGTTPFVVGRATARVEVANTAISLTPEEVSLRGGENEVFTVQVPAALKGTATLSYRWSTTGDFGSLDRGSKSYQGASNKTTYTARSQTRGEDQVMVEVLATTNGQTTSLGKDWAIVKVERAPFTLQPAGVQASRDTTVRFTARPNGDLPAQPRYLWTFGDNSAPVTSTDSVITHFFAGEGTYRVGVELQDAPTAKRLAVAGSTVTIGTADTTTRPIWRITRLERVSLTGDIPNDTMRRHMNTAAIGSYYMQEERLANIGAGRIDAYVHALADQTVMPDCFDFDFDQNKTEPIAWPGWIWIQFPDEIPRNLPPPYTCGEDDDVLGHYPGNQGWSNGQGTGMWLGHDQRAYFIRYQHVDLGGYNYADPEFVTVSANLTTGPIAGRVYSEWTCCQTVNDVYAVNEINAQLSGKALSGTMTFTYTYMTYASPSSVTLVRATWRAVYSFDALRAP